ncbi:LapA family protein (plasmid) [Pseudarthrobacter sp. P1]|uniref:LapA family protein n=1 Tax=Pseudarthrobacter sp. P1 TaxID=3418418 RepID=UPI003CE82084
MVWAATATGLVLLVLLIIFILQNQESITLRYFGWVGAVSLGVALFVAAVGGGILVAVAGAARIIQLRYRASHRPRQTRRTRVGRARWADTGKVTCGASMSRAAVVGGAG